MAITPLTATSNTTTHPGIQNEQSAVAESQQTSSTPKPTALPKTEPDSATFSSRAERLAALNNEFSITGPNFRVSAEFINRLQELKFISKDEAERLHDQSTAYPETTNQGSGSQEITDLQKDLETLAGNVAEGSSLALLLTETAEALTSLKSSTPLANAPQYKNLQQRLEQALASDTNALSETDRHRVTQSMDVMLIASRLAPGSETNAGIRSYLANT